MESYRVPWVASFPWEDVFQIRPRCRIDEHSPCWGYITLPRPPLPPLGRPFFILSPLSRLTPSLGWVMLLWRCAQSPCGQRAQRSRWTPGAAVAGSRGNFMLTSLRNCQLFPKATVAFYTSTSQVWGLQFLYVILITAILPSPDCDFLLFFFF